MSLPIIERILAMIERDPLRNGIYIDTETKMILDIRLAR
jgi:hypothetical protein